MRIPTIPGTLTRLDPGPSVCGLDDSFVLTERSSIHYPEVVPLSRAQRASGYETACVELELSAQSHREARPALRSFLHRDRSSVGFRDSLYQTQPEPQPTP